MEEVQSALAIKDQGLEGDRYQKGSGSWNNGRAGHRQLTLISNESFGRTSFTAKDTRRNILVIGVELPTLIGKVFYIGRILVKGVKYCTVCDRPSHLSGKKNFKEQFWERGGIIVEIVKGGEVCVGDEIYVP